MHICKYLLLFVGISITASLSSSAQSGQEKQKHWHALQTAADDTSRVLALLDYGGLYYMSDYDSAEHYYRLARDLSLRINYYRGYQRYVSYQSEINNLKGLFDLNLVNLRTGLEMALKKKDPLYQGVHLSNIGNIHLFKANNDSAAWYFMQASQQFEKAKDSMRMGMVYSNLSIVFENLRQYELSMFYIRRALEIAAATGDEIGVGYALTNQGAAFKRKGLLDSAAISFEKALPIAIRHRETNLEKDILTDFGFIELSRKHHDKASAYFTRALELSKSLKHDYGIVSSEKGLASVLISQKKFSEATALLNKCIALAARHDFKEELQDLYMLLYEAALGNGQSALALSAYQNHIAIKDSLSNIEMQKNIASLEKQYQTERKERQLLQKDTQIAQQITQLRTRKTWILLLSAFILLFIIIAFLTWKFYKQKRLAAARQQELLQVQLSMKAKEEERNRIASELHDDLGGTLSGIIVHTHFMTEQAGQSSPGEMTRSIEKIRNAASEMITKLNDIVWLVNPRYDTIGKLVQRIEDFAMDLARTKGMEVRIQGLDDMEQVPLDPQARKNIYLISKEAINNAVKYSHATQLQLVFSRQGNDLSLSIEDNGCGFNLNGIKKGNGLLNMSDRAKDIGATYSLQALEEKGTRVSLQYKIPQ